MRRKDFFCPAGLCAALLAVWIVPAVTHSSSQSAPATASGPVYAASAADTKAESITPEEKPLKRSAKTGWGRDPFQFPQEGAATAKGAAPNGARLVAIIDGRKGKMAIFGHSIVQKGDSIGNERVLDIEENRVTMLRDGSKRVIAMQEAQ